LKSPVCQSDISVRNAVISGVVVGNITATDSVEITEAGRMVGGLFVLRVSSSWTARAFRGAVDMGDMEAPRASGPLPERAVARPTTALARPWAKLLYRNRRSYAGQLPLRPLRWVRREPTPAAPIAAARPRPCGR